ncbi:MAG: hypothetical protein Q7S34_00835, partial [bacterium]|nr:hypothetical protein [bacterium]
EESDGWLITFVEEMPNIPREGHGLTIANRPQIDTAGSSIKKYIEQGKNTPTPKEYLKAIQNEKMYQNEAGLTPEEDLIYAISHLEETNEVLNDYQGKGSISYNLGALFPASGGVPFSCWDRADRHAHLGWHAFGHRNPGCGVRLGVRV